MERAIVLMGCAIGAGLALIAGIGCIVYAIDNRDA